MNGLQRGSPLPYPKNMIRWTAKFLLLVLLAGPFVPMAAAFSMAPPTQAAISADHCVRKPAAAAPSMPGCHHHAAAAPSEPTHTPLAVRSGNCCDGHECCRSMVRSHSANVARRTIFAAVDRAETHVPAAHSSFPDLDLVGSHSVRGPPAL
jgi:hypothetical protein